MKESLHTIDRKIAGLISELDEIRQDLGIDRRQANFLNWAVEELETARGHIECYLKN